MERSRGICYPRTTVVDRLGWVRLSPHGNDNAPASVSEPHWSHPRIQPRASTYHSSTPFVLEMGNKESASNDGLFSSLDRPSTLEARDLRSVAKYMKSDECQNVFVMVCSISPTNIHNAQGSAIPLHLSRHRARLVLQSRLDGSR